MSSRATPRYPRWTTVGQGCGSEPTVGPSCLGSGCRVSIDEAWFGCIEDGRDGSGGHLIAPVTKTPRDRDARVGTDETTAPIDRLRTLADTSARPVSDEVSGTDIPWA